ncbi:MAG: methyltransferase [Isosphaeraceae bacterium]|nr:methyltransferase [Isosphaeraceae bacterium]
MTPQPMVAPYLDATPIFEFFRGNHATELLTAAVAHFRLFERFPEGPKAFDDLRRELELAERPARVLTTALAAMKLLELDSEGRVGPTELAREHLTPGAHFDVSGYVGLAADAPGVVEMVERLRTNRPAGADDGKGTAFIFREGLTSAMEEAASARSLTLALAGRARNVAPLLAERFPLDGVRTLLDVAGGTGIYSIAWLLRHPDLHATVWDLPHVLEVAREMADAHGVGDRLECIPGDMFTDAVPTGAEAVLLSNVLHDWDVPECIELIRRCAHALPVGGRILIHDVFLDDSLDGPLPIALYSAALFRLCEGRAYSAAEYGFMLREAGMTPGTVVPTGIHCGVLPAIKTADSPVDDGSNPDSGGQGDSILT